MISKSNAVKCRGLGLFARVGCISSLLRLGTRSSGWLGRLVCLLLALESTFEAVRGLGAARVSRLRVTHLVFLLLVIVLLLFFIVVLRLDLLFGIFGVSRNFRLLQLFNLVDGVLVALPQVLRLPNRSLTLAVRIHAHLCARTHFSDLAQRRFLFLNGLLKHLSFFCGLESLNFEVFLLFLRFSQLLTDLLGQVLVIAPPRTDEAT